MATRYALILATLTLSCGTTPPAPRGQTCQPTSPSDPAPLFVSSSDYGSGALCALSLDATCNGRDLASLTGDSLLRWHGNRLVALRYDVSGGVDGIAYYDIGPDRLIFDREIIPRLGEESANVRDYLVRESRAFFTRNDRSTVGMLDATTLASVGDVDLSALKGEAVQANPQALAFANGSVWVTLQRFPRDFNHWGNGVLAKLDASTGAVQGSVEIGPNPFAAISVRGDAMYVACAGALNNIGDGAIERINARTMAREVIVNERSLGGNALHVLSLDERRLAVVVTAETTGSLAINETLLVEYNLETRAVRTLYRVPEYALTAPVLGGDGRLYIGDRGSEGMRRPSGVMAFDATTGAQAWGAPVNVGLPPYALLAR